MKQTSTEDCIAGVLAPVFALRGSADIGIGDTAALKEFITWASRCGFRVVKLLPINETGGDNSPYNAISSRAIEPSTLHFSPKAVPGLGDEDVNDVCKGTAEAVDSSTVNYVCSKRTAKELLHRAYSNFVSQRQPHDRERFTLFKAAEGPWLESYAVFRSLMAMHDEKAAWPHWPEEHRTPESVRIWLSKRAASERERFEESLEFYSWIQWVAHLQWSDAKAHAEAHGVLLMGDVPFGVAYHSVDVWASPHHFLEGWYGGTPPDKVFKHDPFVQKWGQNWGVPVYNWEVHEAEGMQWWKDRLAAARRYFSILRIDHILGFFRVYGFPWAPEDNQRFLELTPQDAMALTGGSLPHFIPRSDDEISARAQNDEQGRRLLGLLTSEMPAGSLVGEDLGEVPPYVRPTLTELGIAGYKIPQWERLPSGDVIQGAAYPRLSLATYGTHDHPPMRALWEGLTSSAPDDESSAVELRALRSFAGLPDEVGPEYSTQVHEALLRALLESNSWLVVLMVTDVFARTERFNLPGTAGGQNWTQRMHLPVSDLSRDPYSEMVCSLVQTLRPGGRGGK